MKAGVYSEADVAAEIVSFGNFARSLDEIDKNAEHLFHDRLRRIEEMSNSLSPEIKKTLRTHCLKETESELCQSTMIQHGRSKPFGYSGDFQMIDWTYTKHVESPTRRGEMWDRFYHRQVAPLAVCSRKDRFGEQLKLIAKKAGSRITVLNTGSGPGREVLDGAASAGLRPGDLEITCVDADKAAIEYAKRLLGEQWCSSCHFEHKNALRYHPKEQFDLAWSSGLFDYLDERMAAHLLKIMWANVKVGGRLVICNFADTHSTRPWIEWCGDWFLIHRSQYEMQLLAEYAGIVQGEAKISHDVDSLQAVRYLSIEKLA